MRKPCVIANWKMNGSPQLVLEMITAFRETPDVLNDLDVVICPPVTYLPMWAQGMFGSPLLLGAQNVFYETAGAYTGELSPQLLKEAGCQYVILGHSERRHWMGEDDTLIAKKFLNAYDQGLIPVLCVGETLWQKESGKTQAIILAQLEEILTLAPAVAFEKALIAYEPVWAIGKGVAATAEEVQSVHAYIRNLFSEIDLNLAQRLRILYGGSLQPANSSKIFLQPDVDGGLVGGASLDVSQFLAICHAAVVTV